MEEPVELPIDGILDLHSFNPREIKSLISDYIEECVGRNITRIRIIHGKGTGILRRKVHAILRKNRFVESFRVAYDDSSATGATIVNLVNREGDR
ncbi:MAG TPA: DNA mismatch repair protein MutS [Candidatus Marinimicrobia bacterium]|nr:DNA mismatch repair protein MutS [Candidatus Neomarinimicrobiota bacterium]